MIERSVPFASAPSRIRFAKETPSGSRAIHTEQLSVRIACSLERIVNPPRLSGKIRIGGANHDARVLRRGTVQADEMLSVQRHHRPVLPGGVGEHIRIRPRLPGASGFLHRGDIAAEPVEFFHHGQGKFSFA